MLIFDDFFEEIQTNSRLFAITANAGRHRGLNTKYIKHILFNQHKLGRDNEFKNIRIVLFTLMRDI